MRPSDRWYTVVVCVLLVVAVWIVFGQTVRHEFVNYDDERLVYGNSAITPGLDWRKALDAFARVNAQEWYPLTSLSHMLDCQLYGLKAGGHHLTNVLLHAATAILLFLALRSMTAALWSSAFVAALFAIHPLRVESVAWVSERKDVLSGLFFMATLRAYARYAAVQSLSGLKPSSRPRDATINYWLTLFLFTLGLLSKTMLATLPLVLLLLDYWPLGRIALRSQRPIIDPGLFRRLIIEKIPFLVLSIAACAATILAQAGALPTVQEVGFLPRIGNALVAYTAYLRQMVLPMGLAVFYPHPGNSLSILTVSWSLLVLLMISAGVGAGWRKHPYLLVGWLWYLGMLVPVIGILQVGAQARADRYTYLPQIGLYILVTWGAVDLCRNWRHRRAVLLTVATAILASLLAVAHVQATRWRDSVSLWTHTLACTSNNPVARNNLGAAFAGLGRWLEAGRQFEEALRLKPDYADALSNLGLALAKLGMWSEAVRYYERALQLDPVSAATRSNLGLVLASQGRLNEATQQFQQALSLATAQGDLSLAETVRAELKRYEPASPPPPSP